MYLDPATGDWSLNHRTLTSIVAPRPIGWVSSRSQSDGLNLAPFSYFNGICTNPPVIVIGASDSSDGGLKDTTANILETGEFVVNMVTEKHVAAVDQSGQELDTDVDEFEYAGLDTVDSQSVDVPRVAGVPAALECTLHKDDRMHDVTVIYGDVKRFYIDESVCTDGKIDTTKIDAVGRMGGPFFTSVDLMDFHRGEG